MKNLLTLIGLVLFMNASNAQGSWAYHGETYIKGSIIGTITQGFIFITNSGEYFVVDERTHQKVKTLNPYVGIMRSGIYYKLTIHGFDEPLICKKIENVVETQIDGEFEGWKGETIFKMINGQIWKQNRYEYKIHHAYNPEVLIYQYKGSWIMKVKDVVDTIEVILID